MKQEIKRKDPAMLAKRRHEKAIAKETAKLPGFRNPVLSLAGMIAEYESRDDPEVVRNSYDRLYRQGWKSMWALRERARPLVTPEQFVALQDMRNRLYPPTPSYGAEFWRGILVALLWCPEPIIHDVKARCVSAKVLGARTAFFSYVQLEDGRVAAQVASPEMVLRSHEAGVPFLGKQDSDIRPGKPLVLGDYGVVQEWPEEA